MIRTWTVRIVRAIGGLVLAASIGVFVGVILWQCAHGPDPNQQLIPSERLWRCFRTTLFMASAAGVGALVLALPAAFVMATARSPRVRAFMLGMTLVPLVTMPSVFSFAWWMLATLPGRFGGWVRAAIAWDTPGAHDWHAAFALAAWLWPIPALILAEAYRREGRGVMRLASLDASPARAAWRAVLPAMRGPIVASMAIVFILAATEGASPAILMATQTWPYEMKATQAVLAMSKEVERPAAFMAFASWPMLAVLAAALALAAPPIMRLARWGSTPDEADVGGTNRGSARRTQGLALIATAAITLFPIAVLVHELWTGRFGMVKAFTSALQVYKHDGSASLVVAAITGLAAVVVAVALLDEPSWPRYRRRWASAVAITLLLIAASPPELIVSALTPTFVRMTDPARWNFYDDTPWAWVAGMLVRFGFIAVWIGRIAGRRLDPDLAWAAAADGARPVQSLALVRLPQLWRPLAVAGVLVACMTLADISTSVGLEPSGFIGKSLAVRIDQQMHFGRNDEVVACSLMLMVPAVVAAMSASLLMGRWEQRHVQ